MIKRHVRNTLMAHAVEVIGKWVLATIAAAYVVFLAYVALAGG